MPPQLLPAVRQPVSLATNFTTQKCARCFHPLQDGPTLQVIYEDGDWYHCRCLAEGKRQCAEARKRAHAAYDHQDPQPGARW
jgi:hypothetical protein